MNLFRKLFAFFFDYSPERLERKLRYNARLESVRMECELDSRSNERRLRAKIDLVEAECHLEYFTAIVPMLQARVSRMEAGVTAEQAMARLTKPAKPTPPAPAQIEVRQATLFPAPAHQM